MSTLYIVATPIGNLEDITLRAIRILKEVDLVLCEDTRVTKKLLRQYEIDTATMSYHAHSKITKEEKIIAFLEEGKSVALVSDAGTPAISDPGAMLVQHIREHFNLACLPEPALPAGRFVSGSRINAGESEINSDRQSVGSDRQSVGSDKQGVGSGSQGVGSGRHKCGDVKIESVPGPSALTAAFSIAGIPVSDFTFYGFLPHKKGRQTLFQEIAGSERAAIFYESPHRIEKALTSLQEFCPNKTVTLVRELTKIYEDVLQGSAETILETLKEYPEKLRGEMVVIVSEQK